MIEIGKGLGSLKFDEVGERMLTVIGAAERNKIFILHDSASYLDLSAANTFGRLEIPIFKQWRVIGLGMLWALASTAGEDPAVDFGYNSDDNAFGNMTSAITGGEKFVKDDHIKYDPYDLLADEVVTEASATLDVTWTAGVAFAVWQTSIKDIRAYEAAVGGITTGTVKPYMVIEVNSGGRW